MPQSKKVEQELSSCLCITPFMLTSKTRVRCCVTLVINL